MAKASGSFSLVETEKFQVSDSHGGGTTVNIDEVLFIRRRENLVSFSGLFILTASLVLIRIITRAFTNNDLHVGIELLLKDTLNMPPYDSMLSAGDLVDYQKSVYNCHKRWDVNTCGCA
eukprot:GFKZ01013211.1.p2 GENE.GFKZ01013211.1~~GFKZ01013211.1.p2  ORF type:complete len:119 (+),score=9.75 GFKZ01013211.1:186-542(+)